MYRCLWEGGSGQWLGPVHSLCVGLAECHEGGVPRPMNMSPLRTYIWDHLPALAQPRSVLISVPYRRLYRDKACNGWLRLRTVFVTLPLPLSAVCADNYATRPPSFGVPACYDRVHNSS
jgi:hypothetical protein